MHQDEEQQEVPGQHLQRRHRIFRRTVSSWVTRNPATPWVVLVSANAPTNQASIARLPTCIVSQFGNAHSSQIPLEAKTAAHYSMAVLK